MVCVSGSGGNERTLFFVVTTSCDIACSYCFYTTGYQQRGAQPGFDCSSGSVLLDKLLALDFKTVILTGGDPLGRRSKEDTFRLVSILKTGGIRTIINTSGAYLVEEDCRRLAALGPDRVDFSIDSHIEEVHDSQRGRFKDIVEAIKTLKALGYDSIASTTVVTRDNQDSLDETMDFLESLGVQDRRVQPAFLPGSRKTTAVMEPEFNVSLKNSLCRLAEVSASAQSKHCYFAQWQRYSGGEEYPVVPGARPWCMMGKSYFVSDAQGNLTGCFHRSDVQLGNLLSDAPAELEKRIAGNQLTAQEVPPCVGRHCVSLFDGKRNWVTD